MKPFNETKIFKILSGKVAKVILSKVPFGIGSTFSDLMTSSKDAGNSGTMSREKLVHNLVKMGVYAILIWLALSGKISWDDADQAKEFLQN